MEPGGAGGGAGEGMSSLVWDPSSRTQGKGAAERGQPVIIVEREGLLQSVTPAHTGPMGLVWGTSQGEGPG